MYQPAHFSEDRVAVMHELMRAHPFAALVSVQHGRVTADHLPLAIHEEEGAFGVVRGHIAKANPLWQNAASVGEVLTVFQGPQAYVTPSWYPSKQEHGKVVPTWNYAVVHARGVITFVDDAAWLLAHLDEMTARQERHRANPWAVADAPDDFMARQMRGIVGIEIEIAEIEGKWKVSQNKDSRDRDGVRDGLLHDPEHAAIEVGELVGKYAG